MSSNASSPRVSPLHLRPSWEALSTKFSESRGVAVSGGRSPRASLSSPLAHRDCWLQGSKFTLPLSRCQMARPLENSEPCRFSFLLPWELALSCLRGGVWWGQMGRLTRRSGEGKLDVSGSPGGVPPTHCLVSPEEEPQEVPSADRGRGLVGLRHCEL